MQKLIAIFLTIVLGVLLVSAAPNSQYKLLKTVSLSGDGGYDYIYADSTNRRLYIPRLEPQNQITIFDLDTLQQVGLIQNVKAHGVAVSPVSHHGFATSKPVAMWDTNTFRVVKTIDVGGKPDGILYDPYNDNVYVFSHEAPQVTVINASDGSVVGTLNLGGAPEEAVSDENGHIYVDIEDKDSISVIDAKSLSVIKSFTLGGKGGVCAGLAIDIKNQLLFASCRNPQTMVVLGALDGAIVSILPIGKGTDGAVFNSKTAEVFSSQGDGTLTIIKENDPSAFAVEQTLVTTPNSRTLTLDSKTNRIFSVAAQFGPAPADSAHGEYRRGPMIPGTFSVLVVGK